MVALLTRLQSRRMTLFVLKQAYLEKKHFVNQVVHESTLMAWGNYSRVVDLEILIHFKLLFFKCEHVSSVNGAKACSPWRNSNWNAEIESKIYLWKFVALSVLTERIWVIQTPNHHDWRNRRISKKEEQSRLLLKLYEKRIQYFVWKNNPCQGRLTCCAEVFSSRPFYQSL